MSELDKFKRRIIRSVARLLLKEKKPEEELWKEMKKETGSDCRTLWERMRALCVKKLNRMIAVDDRSANLPSIARLSLTDWLLVDLVLVHEEIDVIAMDKPDNKEYPALIELFSLVQRFDIEGRAGESLAEAWAAATVYYNRQGRQCSPMLLQRRWYQLKKLTRCRFYKFWFSYKGNTRLLEEARKSMPTRLQMAIAKRYPQVITKEYPDWEELIEKRFVIMPEKFEEKMRMPNLPKPCNSNAPDLVVVEPVIETIDLRIESDPEDQNDDEIEDTSDPERSNDATDITHPATEDEFPVPENPITEEEMPVAEEIPINDDASGIQVKTEPMEEDGLSNVQLISATHVPEVEIPDDGPDETPEAASTNSDEVVVKSEVSQMETSQDDDEDDVIEIPSVTPVVERSPDIVQREAAEIPSNNVPCDADIINDSDEAVDDIIKVKADEYCRKKEEVPVEKNNAIDDLIKDKLETYLKTPKEAISLSDKKPDVDSIDLKNKANVAAIDLMADLNFVDDGIEFVDDGVEFIEEDHAQTIESTSIEDNLPAVEQPEEEDEESNKFDLKLLMYPVVYTTKLDQMKTFKNKEIDSVKGIEDIEMAAIESKPVSNKSLDIKIKEESVINTAEDTADSDDLFTNREVTDDEESEEDIIVSPTSYMLKKPRTRTYDPIKLCKNPDFNTKLKRLTIGFLSSTRNRQFLNACIPMTIDLSKAFESKLRNGTLYLKSSGTAPIVEKQEGIEKQASSIVPTAMPVQSLIDNSKVDIQNLIPHPSPIVSERTKVINLPDIDKVRRINQQLLTAQVPPLRVFAGNSRAINPQEVNPTVSTVPSIEPVQPVTDSTSIQNTAPRIKIEGEKSENDSLPTETLPPAKEKLIKMINQAKILTKEALDKIDDATKPKDFPMPIVVQEVKNIIPQDVPTRKHHYQPRVPLPWAPKHAVLTKKNFDDFGLLTSDTLNKMLHLLTSGNEGHGCKCCNIPKKKKKKGKCKKSEDQQKESENSDSVQEVDKEDESKKSDDAVPKQAPKQTTKVVPVSKVGKTKFCCWANQKLNNRRRNSKHLCPPNPCQCCCADKLVKKIQADEEARKLKMMTKTVVELSDDEEDSLRKACESIETVVQQSALLTNQAKGRTSAVPAVSVVDRIPFPVVNVVKRLDVPTVTVMENTPRVPTVTEVDNVSDVPDVTVVSPEKPSAPSINVEVVAPSISKVTIDLGVDANEIKETPTTPPKPNIKIRAAPISSLMPADRPIINRPTMQINPVTVNRAPVQRVQMRSQLKPSQWATCTCQRPALSQDTRRNIVIDASTQCVIHPTPIAPKQIVSPQKTDASHQIPETPKEKIVYLHSKNLAKSPSESPIFLGKNKILLTTVKFPRKNDEVAPPPTEVFQAPKVIPTLPLPAGVQLVLMPSGNVTYTVDPGVELDEVQLAALPTILAAVQEQLNASGVTSSPAVPEPQVSRAGDVEPITTVTQPETTDSENINLSQSAETAETPQAKSNINQLTDSPKTLETNEVFQDTELPPKNTNNVDMEVDTQSTKADTPTEQDTSTTTSTSDLEKGSVPMANDMVNEATIDAEAPKDITEPLASAQTSPVIKESQSEIQRVAEDKEAPEVTQEIQSVTEGKEDGISNRKSLLSDLMEMSGISAEDATAPDPPAPEPVIDQVQHAAIVNDESKNLPELSPVTSFAELKYACEQNGKFFKLDFDTGVIVPINVCIKKNPKTKTTPTKTKEFIDLTEDVESSDVDNNETQATQNKSTESTDRPTGSSLLKEPVEYIYNGKTVNVSSSIVKPVKLFKACHSTPKVPRVLKAGQRTVLSPTNTPISLLKRTHVEKRKQKFTIVRAKVEAKIDLVDSDEPMEEEYLVDSSDDDKSQDDTGAEPMLVEALNTSLIDDSSDDEPLAKKSKRLKESDEKEVRETNIFDEIPDATSPDELTNDVNDLVEHIETAAVTGGTDQVQQISVKKAVVTNSNKDTTDKLQAKVRNTLDNVIVRSEGPIVEVNVHNPVDNQSDDEEDKSPPELRFMSDHSENGDGEEDCILGF
ncbi:uncharacterized protein LOC134673726 isoform X2 [Cydia fagiglandana]|uniref:uncharacterized protein LOC134673726 isoform X2 n=2 Tax=Cydia fagiglandana TaxID=1458189 RepID=UPI002FEE1EDE